MNDLERLLRDDLRAAAGSVDISVTPDDVAAERDRMARRTTRLRWVVAVVVVALLAAALWWVQTGSPALDRAVPDPLRTPPAVLPSATPTLEPTPEASATPAPEPTAEASATPSAGPVSAPSPGPGRVEPSASAAPGRTVGMFVYFVSADTLTVVREWRQVTAATPARGALEVMLAGGNDPDYGRVWPPGTRVLGIAKHGDLITVDLSAEANGLQLGSSAEAQAVAAVVYTVTEAFAPTDRVLLTVAGRPLVTGHHDYTRPMARETDPSRNPMQVVIDAPAEGATVEGTVRVTGLAATFEATLHWAVTRPDGTPVAEGNTSTDEGQVLSAFAFDLPALAPGTYDIRVTLDDPSGGEGPAPHFDDKRFTVAR